MKHLTITLLALLVLGGCLSNDFYQDAYRTYPDYKAWAVGYYTLEGDTLYVGDPKKEVLYITQGRSTQEIANKDAIAGCDRLVLEEGFWRRQGKVIHIWCELKMEGNKNVWADRFERAKLRELAYEEYIQKQKLDEQKKEEEKRQAYITELTNRCISFGFEETNTIASCLQQEIFNEKKLALLSKPTYVVKKDKEKDVSWWEKILIEATDPERIEKVRLENRVRALESQRRAPIIINKQ